MNYCGEMVANRKELDHMTIGVFIGVLIISIMLAFVAIDSMYMVKFWKVAGVFAIAILGKCNSVHTCPIYGVK